MVRLRPLGPTDLGGCALPARPMAAAAAATPGAVLSRAATVGSATPAAAASAILSGAVLSGAAAAAGAILSGRTTPVGFVLSESGTVRPDAVRAGAVPAVPATDATGTATTAADAAGTAASLCAPRRLCVQYIQGAVAGSFQGCGLGALVLVSAFGWHLTVGFTVGEILQAGGTDALRDAHGSSRSSMVALW